MSIVQSMQTLCIVHLYQHYPAPLPPLWNPVAFLAASDEREISKPCPPNIGQGDNSKGRTTMVVVLRQHWKYEVGSMGYVYWTV